MIFAIVDDEQTALCQIADQIHHLISGKIELFCFQNATDFLNQYAIRKFDAAFLDIDMPDLSGFELTEKLHVINNNIQIVYITGRDDLITKAFRYRPIGFVRKHRIEQELPFAITTVLTELQKANREITLTEVRAKGGKTHIIPIHDIVYLESIKHNIEVHLTRKKILLIRESLSDFVNHPDFVDFVQIDAGTLVNLAHICWKNEQIELEDGTLLYVSRRRYTAVLSAYLKYIKKVLI